MRAKVYTCARNASIGGAQVIDQRRVPEAEKRGASPPFYTKALCGTTVSGRAVASVAHRVVNDGRGSRVALEALGQTEKLKL